MSSRAAELAPLVPYEPPAHPRLHLGCGTQVLDGYVNVDVVPAPGVVVCDVSLGLPYPDGVFDEVLAVDFLEHIAPARTIHVMNEVWRVLAPDGRFRIHVPAAPGITAFQDPTHVSFWNEETFTYYEDGHPRRERYGVSYGVRARFRRRRLRRRRNLWTRFFTTFDLNYLSNHVLDVELVAVKDPA
jgi:SAM-dependent methyltransferase